MLRSKFKIHLTSSRYMFFLTVGLMLNLAVTAVSDDAPIGATLPGWWQKTRQNLSNGCHGLANYLENTMEKDPEEGLPPLNGPEEGLPPLNSPKKDPSPLKENSSFKPNSGSQGSGVTNDSWNTTYMVGSIAAAAVTVSVIAYWYTVMSWYRAVDKLVIKAQLNPNVILEDLSYILKAWDGSAQQKKIIEYVEERVMLTPELIDLLDLYRY